MKCKKYFQILCNQLPKQLDNNPTCSKDRKTLAKSIKYLIAILLCIGVNKSIIYAQFPDSISMKNIRQLAEDIVSSVEENSDKFQRLSQKRLYAIHDREQKLLRHLNPDALVQSEALMVDIQRKIKELDAFSLNPDSLLRLLPAGPYLERLDSLYSLFEFTKISGTELPIVVEAQKQIANLRREIGYTGMLQEWLQDRQNHWHKLISINNNIIPIPLLDAWKEWQGEFNVYKQQISYWKETLKDSRKLEREVHNQLYRLPAFREFMSRNSELSRLFGPVGSGGNNAAGQPIPGLQSMQSLSEQLQYRFGSAMQQGGGLLQNQLQNGMDQLQQNQTTSVQGLLQEFELPSVLGSGAAEPAYQSGRVEVLSTELTEKTEIKAKPFGKRFEYGWNLQSAMRLQDFPAIRDVGLSIGYKVNPRSVIGIGVAYKFALGESWKNIDWTHEGIGLRSFIDWRLTEAGGKLFKGFWLTGGFELNYWERIADNVQWRELAWRPAGMLGLTKSIPGKRTIGKLQILFNYLENTLPLEDRISVRWGKTF